jgi:hypothetical protein
VASEAPPTERGGNRWALLYITAPTLDPTAAQRSSLRWAVTAFKMCVCRVHAIPTACRSAESPTSLPFVAPDRRRSLWHTIGRPDRDAMHGFGTTAETDVGTVIQATWAMLTTPKPRIGPRSSFGEGQRLPGRVRAALRCRLDAVAFEDRVDRVARHVVGGVVPPAVEIQRRLR